MKRTFVSVVVLALMALVPWVGSDNAMAQTPQNELFLAVQDSYVENGTFADTNFDGAVTINIGLAAGQRIRRGLFEWDLSNISVVPEGSVRGPVVQSVDLRVYRTSTPSTNFVIEWRRINATWNDATVTFNTLPSFNPVAEATTYFANVTPPGSVRPPQPFPLSLVQGWVDNPSNNFGVVGNHSIEGAAGATGWMSQTGQPFTPGSFVAILDVTFLPALSSAVVATNLLSQLFGPLMLVFILTGLIFIATVVFVGGEFRGIVLAVIGAIMAVLGIVVGLIALGVFEAFL